MLPLDPLERLRERAPQAAETLGRQPALRATAARVLGYSDFVLDALVRDSALAAGLATGSDDRPAGFPTPLPAVLERLAGETHSRPLSGPEPSSPAPSADAEDAVMAALRGWRRAELARIAWRDLAGWADLTETLADLSAAADRAVGLAHAFALRALQARHGYPRSEDGTEQSLMVVAMGKLGGGELNFSSDIDLVMLYGSAGETDGPRRLSNQEFFTRLAQAIVRLLAQPTQDGIVFRVDLRLRPFGDSGPTVCSFAALEDYLQIHGRDWERYAWVKARPVTAAAAWEPLYRSTLRPFVYRRYLDFGIFESLREMKALIEREVQRRDLSEDIKLGDGGIREIEFIVQSFQLIRGGQDRRLQCRALRTALPLLLGAKLLTATAVAELDEAYVFLRRLENRLQMQADRQTHRLPEEPQARERLAASMGEDSWPALQRQIDRQRSRVAQHFRAVVFGAPAGKPAATLPVAALPLGTDQLDELQSQLRALGFADGAAAARCLLDFQQSMAPRRLDAIGSRRLAELLPVLAAEAAHTTDALATLRRLLRILEAIGARSAYFALLLHHVRPRARLVELASHGEFLAAQIASHPLLLDELIDEQLLEQIPDRAALAADLSQRLAGSDPEDEEQWLERLRQFQRAALFRIAVADLFARLPVMRVSDRLTEVAELIIEQALALAWQHLTQRLGVPMCGEGRERRPVRLAVIGYGKLGGWELGYASDLDLVFLHDSAGARQETEGARSIDNQVFFVRFAQRLVHLLTVHSAAGRLYEVDMRLRPSGKAGMLITGIEAFAQYQREEAWTFEHQALLHARAVAGSPELRERFEAMRLQILADCVRRDRLREDVRHMRLRMRHELSRAAAQQVDLKQDPGGIADIEFLAQFWALQWARQYPPVVRFSDTIRQLESVGSADLIAQATIDVLTSAYRGYRTCLHHRALDGLGAVVPEATLYAERAAVLAIWNRYLGEEPAG
ncbi:MAG TPA: bifunctional [glutamate--ammonia ligase]-adenylyl-L-tyrosine phosphorylase/[glutamate--ammonia-ligase] adenylyltransferase [Steroidobacteraceae bacterium]|nr:bifunctional [glutamate--ammonia ligase]-adenylyl-L-tyrosine phosphorylase/[glutamate--ammonia-ligase] adenylyltransferase [Steroidobacteraceae bacterium]